MCNFAWQCRWTWLPLFAGFAAQAAEQAPPANGATPVCEAGVCTVVADTAYPSLVIGLVDHVATQEEAAALFARALVVPAWSQLPPLAQAFAQKVRVVVVVLPPLQAAGSRPLKLALLTTDDEYGDDGFEPGTLVRYKPHGATHEDPPSGRPDLVPYWPVTGCVLPLCQSHDPRCRDRYLQGVFDVASGFSVDWHTGLPVSPTAVIDPRTKLPLNRPASGPSG